LVNRAVAVKRIIFVALIGSRTVISAKCSTQSSPSFEASLMNEGGTATTGNLFLCAALMISFKMSGGVRFSVLMWSTPAMASDSTAFLASSGVLTTVEIPVQRLLDEAAFRRGEQFRHKTDAARVFFRH
jgi:hypothetical protein